MLDMRFEMKTFCLKSHVSHLISQFKKRLHKISDKYLKN